MLPQRTFRRRHARPAASQRGAARLETLERRVLLTAPTATLSADDVVNAGGTRHAFVVDYDDDAGLNRFTIDDLDIRVTGPLGFNQQAKLVSRQAVPNGEGFRAVYRIEAPGGSWDAPDNGTYTVRLLDDAVLDLDGNAAPGGELGTFDVQADVFDLSDNVPGNLGVVDGLVIVPNLNTLDSAADGFVFQMAGTGQPGEYVRIDYVAGEGFLRPKLFRQTGRSVAFRVERDIAGDVRGNVVTKFIPMAELPAGTYTISIENTLEECDDDPCGGCDCELHTFHNPNYTLSVRAGRVNPPELSPTVHTGALPPVIVPGDRVRASIRVTNRGLGYAAGSVDVSFFLSQDQALDASDVVIGVSQNRVVNLLRGRSRHWRPVVDLPGAAQVQPGDYFLITHVDSGNLIPEGDDQNNIVVSAETIRVERAFGKLEGRRNARYRIQDVDGTHVILSIAGPGTGEVIGDGEDAVIVLRGTTDRSTLRIATFGGDREWSIAGIVAGDPQDPQDPQDRTSLRAISARGVNVDGDVTVTGTLRFVNLNDVTGAIAIGPPGDSRDFVTMRLGEAADLDIDSRTPIRSMWVDEWGESDGEPDAVAAPSINVLGVRGDMAGVAMGLTRLVGDRFWVRALGRMIVRGAMRDVTLRSAGHIGFVTAGAMIDTRIYAGVDPAATGLPATLDAVVSPAMIGGVVARGTRDDPFAFVRSVVAADEVRRVSLRLVDTAGAEPFGVAARSIRSLFARTEGDFIRLRRVDDFEAFDPVGAFDVRLLG